MNILKAMADKKLFRKTFKHSLLGEDSWIAWKAFLAALFALDMDAEARAIYEKHTGRTDVPEKQFTEAFLICGRRSGKSLVAALIAVYLACFRNYDDVLAPGETGTLMVLAADRRQAKTIFNYIKAFLDVPLLRHMVLAKRNESIDLDNRVRIEVHTSSFRSVRGFTIIGAICDEVAFWNSEETANPDVEVFSALRPAMATVPNALLIGISSPYARRGELFNAFREHFGKRSDVLVWQSDSRSMNPTLSAAVVEAAYVKDASSARAEYGAQFRDDVESFLSLETVEARIIPGRRELPFDSGKTYYGFVDPSGGVSDSFTLGIAHLEHDRAVLDVLREAQSPLSPKSVTAEFAAILKAYRISEIEGDRYAGEWPREEFQKYGVNYKVSEKNKNELYLELLPALMSGQAELLDNPRLTTQLTGLERRTARGGRDSIDHPPNSHDDVANAAAGALGLVLTWNVTGLLGVIEHIKRESQRLVASFSRSTKAKTQNVVTAQEESTTPVVARAEGFQKWLQSGKAPACTACGSTATTYRSRGDGAPAVACNQCNSTDGIPPPQTIPIGDTCCGAPLQWVAGMRRCQNCGRQFFPGAPPAVNGMSRADYAAGAGRQRSRI